MPHHGVRYTKKTKLKKSWKKNMHKMFSVYAVQGHLVNHSITKKFSFSCQKSLLLYIILHSISSFFLKLEVFIFL